MSGKIISFIPIHALWYIRVSDPIPVLELKGILRVFEYSRPLHPPLRPLIQYWGTLMRNNFPVLNTLPKLDFFPIKSLTVVFLAQKWLFWEKLTKLPISIDKIRLQIWKCEYWLWKIPLQMLVIGYWYTLIFFQKFSIST